MGMLPAALRLAPYRSCLAVLAKGCSVPMRAPTRCCGRLRERTSLHLLWLFLFTLLAARCRASGNMTDSAYMPTLCREGICPNNSLCIQRSHGVLVECIPCGEKECSCWATNREGAQTTGVSCPSDAFWCQILIESEIGKVCPGCNAICRSNPLSAVQTYKCPVCNSSSDMSARRPPLVVVLALGALVFAISAGFTATL